MYHLQFITIKYTFTTLCIIMHHVYLLPYYSIYYFITVLYLLLYVIYHLSTCSPILYKHNKNISNTDMCINWLCINNYVLDVCKYILIFSVSVAPCKQTYVNDRFSVFSSIGKQAEGQKWQCLCPVIIMPWAEDVIQETKQF